MPAADLPGVRLHYEIGGDGPPLMLIAGMFSDSASWRPLVAALQARFTVIRPDNRTTGRTEAVRPGLRTWAGDALALVDHLGLASVNVTGHSLGGLIALQLCSVAPSRVARLALLAAAPVKIQRSAEVFHHLLRLRGEGMAPDLWLRGFFPWLFHRRLYDDPAAIEAMVAGSLSYPHGQTAAAMTLQLQAFDRAHAELSLPAHLPPTLAILADEDLLMPLQAARRALADLSAVRIVEIAGAGHSVHWDAPGAVAAALVEHFG